MATNSATRQRVRKLPLPCLLLFTYLLSAGWSIATPVPNNDNKTGLEWGNFYPDEGSHTDVVRYMAQWGRLPPYDATYYISVHPPLYHGLCATVYGMLLSQIGYDHAMLLVRLLTALCGVGIVWLTYRTARRVAPYSTSLLAATFVALLPMRASLGGAITNENLAALGAAGTLATIAGGICDRDGFKTRQIALLALYLCIGIGSKITCLGLLPVVGIALFWKVRSQRRPLALAAGQLLLLAGVVVACWGWWFARNQIVYGDLLRNAAADRLWRIPNAAAFTLQDSKPIVYWLRIAWNSWRSFWGMFDGSQRPMPGLVTVVIALVQAVCVAGLCSSRQRRHTSARKTAVIALFGLFTAFVVAFFSLYNVRHYAPQGRYFFVLLLPFGLLSALGWEAALPRSARRRLTPVLLAFLVLLNLFLLYVIPRRLTYSLALPPERWRPAALPPDPGRAGN